MSFNGFSNAGVSFVDTSMVLVNLCTIYADISRTVKNTCDDLNLYTDMYKSLSNPVEKIYLGKRLVEMACLQGGLMSTLINNPAMLQVDLSAVLKFSSECNELIKEMEEILILVGEEKKLECSLLIIESKNILYQNKLWIYRFIDIGELLEI